MWKLKHWVRRWLPRFIWLTFSEQGINSKWRTNLLWAGRLNRDLVCAGLVTLPWRRQMAVVMDRQWSARSTPLSVASHQSSLRPCMLAPPSVAVEAFASGGRGEVWCGVCVSYIYIYIYIDFFCAHCRWYLMDSVMLYVSLWLDLLLFGVSLCVLWKVLCAFAANRELGLASTRHAFLLFCHCSYPIAMDLQHRVRWCVRHRVWSLTLFSLATRSSSRCRFTSFKLQSAHVNTHHTW